LVIGRFVVLAVFVVGGSAILASATRTFRRPLERWLSGRGRWMIWVSLRRGEAAPTAPELRLWAGVWLVVGIAVVAVGVVIVFLA